MYFIDVYKKGVGTLKTFDPVKTLEEVNKVIDTYISNNNLTIIAKEYCGDEHWNYLSDGTEIDYSYE